MSKIALHVAAKIALGMYFTTHFTDMCIPHFFSLPNGVRRSTRSTQTWLQNLAPFQIFINTSVIQDIQDKTLTIYINFGKFKLERRQIL